jgi:hypothetical protein
MLDIVNLFRSDCESDYYSARKRKRIKERYEPFKTLLPEEVAASSPIRFWLELSTMMFNSALVRRVCRTFLLAGGSSDSLPVGCSQAIALPAVQVWNETKESIEQSRMA